VSRAGLVVADASAVVAVLDRTSRLGGWATGLLHGPQLVAPRVMPFEVGGALRRLELRGALDGLTATVAHGELIGLDVRLWPHRQLAGRAWELRGAVAYADACYVALAELLDAPLVTLDRRLAQAPGPRCAFLTPPEQ
jgi:predicted nucleic acid-binding protein